MYNFFPVIKLHKNEIINLKDKAMAYDERDLYRFRNNNLFQMCSLIILHDSRLSQRWLWRIICSDIMTPCSLLEVRKHFGGT
jgi:hypothetical protein